MWNKSHPHAALHHLNYLRIPFIQEQIGRQKFEGLRFLDVGCGEGILSEPLARLGAEVTGIDQDHEVIARAPKSSVSYIHTDLFSFTPDEPFDGVVASEVLEHIHDVPEALIHFKSFLKPQGWLFISTLNKTWFSYLGAIVCAEYLLQVVPKGTHAWSSFIAPSQLDVWMSQSGFTLKELKGMAYNPFKEKWHWSSSMRMNYMAFCQKVE